MKKGGPTSLPFWAEARDLKLVSLDRFLQEFKNMRTTYVSRSPRT
jgi:hypothetical protein